MARTDRQTGARDEPPPAGDHVDPADVLGVPLVPPRAATRVGDRFRAGLARLHRATAPPPARLLEAALGTLDLAALAALCELDVPDRLTGPRRCEELASELEVDAGRLERLLGYAATRGWLRLDRRGRVRPTLVTTFLRRDHAGGWRAWIEFAAGREITAALAALPRGLAAGGDAFAAANGTAFFAWMQAHPDRHVTFDAAMAAGGRMHGLLLAHALEWTDSRRVCDIGGGDGALLGVLLAQRPHLEGVLLELPEVVQRAPVRARVIAVAGDAFDAVPPGADTYLFVNVLHDWDDRAATRLLQRAADALHVTAPRTGRVVVVDSAPTPRPRDDLAARVDLLMMALTPGGRERTTAAFAVLGSDAGLRLDRSHHLPTGDVAHVLVPDAR